MPDGTVRVSWSPFDEAAVYQLVLAGALGSPRSFLSSQHCSGCLERIVRAHQGQDITGAEVFMTDRT